MALKGTLTDFAIPDILQLIGQQQKTGTLHLRGKTEEVRVMFREGSILGAAKYVGKRRDPLGRTLVRAGILNDLEIEQAMELGRKSSISLSRVLLEEKLITEMQLRRMLQLQTTETLYQLFEWKAGKYEFKQGEIDDGPVELAPMRVEAVVMEGFKRVDEWPAIWAIVSSEDQKFERIRPLNEPSENQTEPASSDLSLTPEGIVYGLINAERSAKRLAELTNLGKFETFQALANLIKGEFVAAIKSTGSVEKTPPKLMAGRGRLAKIVAIAASVCFIGLGNWSAKGISGLKRPGPISSYSDPAAQRFLSQAQLARINAAVDLFRLETGEVPDRLEALVKAGLLNGDDLKYPWRETYYYRKTAPWEFVLLPPLR